MNYPFEYKEPAPRVILHRVNDAKDNKYFSLHITAPDDPTYLHWYENHRYRQNSKDDRAVVNPYKYLVRTREWLERYADTGEPDEAREPDPLWPNIDDYVLGLWVQRCSEGSVKQSYVINRFKIPRGILQRLVSHWRKFGLLPYREHDQTDPE